MLNNAKCFIHFENGDQYILDITSFHTIYEYQEANFQKRLNGNYDYNRTRVELSGIVKELTKITTGDDILYNTALTTGCSEPSTVSVKDLANSKLSEFDKLLQDYELSDNNGYLNPQGQSLLLRLLVDMNQDELKKQLKNLKKLKEDSK